MHCKKITEGVCLIARPALNRVRQCVDAGCCRNFPRELCDHPHVQNDIIRNHFFVDNADFKLLFRNGDNRVRRRFGAGAGSRGNHDGLDKFSAERRLIQQVMHAVAVGRENGGKLCRIHDAAAADGDDDICLLGAECIDQDLHLGIGRLRGKIVQNHRFHTRLREHLHRKFQKTCTTDAVICEDGYLFHVIDRHDILQLLQRMLAAINFLRHLQRIICNQIRTNCCAGCLHARPHSSLIPVVAGLVVGARMCLARVCAAQPEIAGLYAGTLIIAEIL